MEPSHECNSSIRGGPRPRGYIRLPQTVPNSPMSPVPEEGPKARVHVQHLEQHVRSLPCHPGEESKTWEDLTRTDVTRRDPARTSPPAHSHLGSSHRSRQAPGGVLCGWAGGGHLRNDDLCLSPVLVEDERLEVSYQPHEPPRLPSRAVQAEQGPCHGGTFEIRSNLFYFLHCSGTEAFSIPARPCLAVAAQTA